MNISLIGSINNLGYGLTTLNFVVELQKLGQRVSLFPMGEMSRVGTVGGVYNCDREILMSDKYQGYIFNACKNSETYDYDAPSVRIWHQNNLSLKAGKGKSIGFPIFELNRFNDVELHHLKGQDELIVCSEWAKQVLVDNGVQTPIHVVPLGVDRSIFDATHTLEARHTYKFINIGKWEVRKGHDIVVEVFNKAFTKDDNVELIMACSNPFLNEVQTKEWIDLYKNSELGNKIRIVSQRLATQEQLADLISKCDAGIFPARAEGWNLDLLECLACGLPVIATNYSGHTEFCTKDNALLVDCPNLESAYDGIWFHGQGDWAEIGNDQIDQMVEHMRYLFKNDIGSNQNGILTGQKYTWENAAKKLITTLE